MFLCPYQSCKFSFHSESCIYLGYSHIHNWYKCKNYKTRNFLFLQMLFLTRKVFTINKYVLLFLFLMQTHYTGSIAGHLCSPLSKFKVSYLMMSCCLRQTFKQPHLPRHQGLSLHLCLTKITLPIHIHRYFCQRRVHTGDTYFSLSDSNSTSPLAINLTIDLPLRR